jgi:hypothetical protein
MGFLSADCRFELRDSVCGPSFEDVRRNAADSDRNGVVPRDCGGTNRQDAEQMEASGGAERGQRKRRPTAHACRRTDPVSNWKRQSRPEINAVPSAGRAGDRETSKRNVLILALDQRSNAVVPGSGAKSRTELYGHADEICPAAGASSLVRMGVGAAVVAAAGLCSIYA